MVWDVDLDDADAVVRKYVAPDAARLAAVFGRGGVADAEPVLPGWAMQVDELFEPDAL